MDEGSICDLTISEKFQEPKKKFWLVSILDSIFNLDSKYLLKLDNGSIYFMQLLL